MSREMSRLAMSREIICSGCLRSGMLAISLPGMLRLYLPTDILVQLGVGDSPEAVRLGAVNSLGLPVSDMGDDIFSWPGKRGVPEVGIVTHMEGVARGKEVGGASSEGLQRSCSLRRR
jgi:hypothetical protein